MMEFNFSAWILASLIPFFTLCYVPAWGVPLSGQVPDLIHALDDEDPAVIARINETLLKVGPSAIPLLIRALDDDNYIVRERVMALLGDFGPRAKEAVPAVIEHLSDTNFDVQPIAEEALVKMGPVALPSMARTLQHSEDGVRRQVVLLLPRFGFPALPILLDVLKHDPSWFVRMAAIDGLTDMRPAPAESVSALQKVLREPDDRLRLAAINALAQLGPEASRAISDLKRIAKTDKDTLICQKSKDALHQIIPEAVTARSR